MYGSPLYLSEGGVDARTTTEYEGMGGDEFYALDG
jgi:hypothetical protein